MILKKIGKIWYLVRWVRQICRASEYEWYIFIWKSFCSFIYVANNSTLSQTVRRHWNELLGFHLKFEINLQNQIKCDSRKGKSLGPGQSTPHHSKWSNNDGKLFRCISLGKIFFASDLPGIRFCCILSSTRFRCILSEKMICENLKWVISDWGKTARKKTVFKIKWALSKYLYKALLSNDIPILNWSCTSKKKMRIHQLTRRSRWVFFTCVPL